jgi:tetratricopeptide (TPR) repeat protein
LKPTSIVLAALTVVLVALAQSPAGQPASNKAGTPLRSIDELTTAIKTSPTSALYAERAAVYLLTGNAADAENDYSAAIRMRLDEPGPWIGRGRARTALGRFSAAIDDLDQAIRLKPDSSVAFLERGYAYGKMGEFPRAIQDLTRSLELENSVAVLTLRGSAYQATDQPAKALEDYTAALAISPNEPQLTPRSAITPGRWPIAMRWCGCGPIQRKPTWREVDPTIN